MKLRLSAYKASKDIRKKYDDRIFTAGMLDSIKKLLNPEYIEKIKAEVEKLSLDESQKNLLEEIGLKYLNEKYHISEEDINKPSSEETPDLKTASALGDWFKENKTAIKRTLVKSFKFFCLVIAIWLFIDGMTSLDERVAPLNSDPAFRQLSQHIQIQMRREAISPELNKILSGLLIVDIFLVLRFWKDYKAGYIR